MFGNDVPIAFKDDAGSVGGANDGTYSAVIPDQPAGNLIRYKISATASGQTLSYPGAGDTRGYDGVVVTRHLRREQRPAARCSSGSSTTPATTSWPARSATTSTTRASSRGRASSTTTRRSGAGVTPPARIPSPRSRCSCRRATPSTSTARSPRRSSPSRCPASSTSSRCRTRATPIPGLGWDHIGDLTDPTVGYLPVRSQRNAAFFGAGAILEEYDGSWRGRKGMNDGAFYKVEAGGFRTYSTAAALLASGDFAKKDPDDTDYTDAWQLTQMLNQGPSATKTAWIWANINVPEMVEYLATTVELRHWDSGGKNFYVFRDASSTGRWQILSWDLDGIFSGGSDTKGDFITPDITGGTSSTSRSSRSPRSRRCTSAGCARCTTSTWRGHELRDPLQPADGRQGRRPRAGQEQVGRGYAVQPDHEGRRRRAGAAHPDRRPHQRHRGPDHRRAPTPTS